MLVGGCIFAVLFFIVFILLFVFVAAGGFPALLILSPLVIPGSFMAPGEIDITSVQLLLGNLIFYFVLGAFFGWIRAKIKNKSSSI